MDKWLITPGLPKSKVTLCAVSENPAAQGIREALTEMGIHVLRVPTQTLLPKPCASHPDMLLCHMGGETIVAGSASLHQALTALGMNAQLAETLPRAPYPHDILLNCLILGDKLFANLKYTAPEILAFTKLKRFTTVSVAQGYARCSVCIVDENSMITADVSIQKAAKEQGIDVLLIQPGFITLPGYDYGFVGGCCGQIGQKHIAFCGNLNTHPDGETICRFLKSKNIKITELPSPDGKLWDIGGIVPLAEKAY